MMALRVESALRAILPRSSVLSCFVSWVCTRVTSPFMVVTKAVGNLIRENKVHQIPSAMQTGGAVGMQTLDMALVDLVNRGLVTAEEAQSRTLTPNLFGAQVRQADGKKMAAGRATRLAAGRGV